jgi:hypothetical protein
MPKSLIFFVLLLLSKLPICAQVSYESYCNSRFAYCIDYPTALVPQGEAGNGDGQRFISKDSKVSLAVWGQFDALSHGIKGQIKMDSEDKKITYKVLKTNWFIISGYTKEGNIFYQKTMLIDDTFKTFVWEYPPAEKAVYDRVCARLVSSFK